MRREAAAALETIREFLYAGCIAVSRYSGDAGLTPMFWEPSSGRVISTGSVTLLETRTRLSQDLDNVFTF